MSDRKRAVRSACNAPIGRPLTSILMVAVAGAALLAHCPAMANADIEHYVGTAYDASGRVLYTESHWISGTLPRRELTVLFRCPDGAPFARKHVVEAGVAQAPSFTLEDARTGYREGVRDGTGGSREVFTRSVEGQLEKRALLKSAPDLVVDAGFDSFIRDHWDALATGAPQHVEFLVPSRLRTYPFTLSLVDDELMDGKPVRRFLMELDTWYGFAIPSIVLFYAADTRTIREYRGIANVRDSTGKSLDVRIEFREDHRATTGESMTLSDARTARLDGACVL
ncbi:MAG: hypothetical protein ABIV12_07760 [Dokdonella sp.]|uniref:hypothetical protein n=1 Tax=Dokdonella sp. TaxID=2291710 RepID=UPI00326559CF